MAVSKRLRYEILRRDSNTCRYCGAKAPDVPLTVDHVTPVALGGTDDPTNLATCCEPCNSGKSATPPNAATVTDVADDAMRWAAAMQQAAEQLREQQQPKLAYRRVFEEAWNSWSWESKGETKTVDLPAEWKTSIDRFREVGLPAEVWPDIVEKAMTNKTVRYDNLFRYCCGIAWRMVRELQETARAIVSPGSSDVKPALSVLGQAIIDVWARSWASEHGDQPSSEARAEFSRSVAEYEARDKVLLPERRIAAAAVGGRERLLTFSESLTAFLAQERADIVIEWSDAWADLGSVTQLRDLPGNFLYTVVQSQVDELDDHGVSLDRIRRAAILAGYHQSTELHHGLRDAELAHTGVVAYRHMATDLWMRSFHATANRWPKPEERGEFMDHISRIGADGAFFVNDLLAASVAAGAYQDPDLTTCLPRHRSVFEAAAMPLQPSA